MPATWRCPRSWRPGQRTWSCPLSATKRNTKWLTNCNASCYPSTYRKYRDSIYASGTRPAPEADAGGDFYDVVRLPRDRIGLLIGDVEGHDTVAAATMGQLRSASRALAGQVHEPCELIDALRWSWHLLGFTRFATALVVRLDPHTGEVSMASAGHLPPAHVRAGGEAHFADVEPSPPLGAPGSPARGHELTLERGDLLFLYTDGLIEQRSVGLEERLDQLLAALWDPAEGPVDELCGRVLSRLGPSKRQDDVAILGLKRLGS